METSRKRKLSDSAEASSSRALVRAVAGDERKLQHPSRATAPEAAEICQRDGHSFSDIHASGQSTNDFGDRYIVHNYGRSPTGEKEEDKRLKDFMKALAFDRMDFRRAAIDPAHGQTCQWIFEHEQYMRWCDQSARSSHHGFFWIKGKPGSGKSTLMRCILEHLQNHRDKGNYTIFSHFFNARGHPLERTIEGLYRSLLYQVFEQLPQLAATIRLPSHPSGGQNWEVAIVRDLFRQAVAKLCGQNVMLVIDALDEGDEDEIRDMVYLIGSLAQSVATLNVCFASRHYPSITIQFCEELPLEVSHHHDQDILQYVLQQLRSRTERERTDLVHQILRKAQGVFLWTVLVVRILNKQFDRGLSQSRRLLSIDTMPDALDTLYDSIVFNGEQDAYLLPTLLWILAGRNGMTIRQLYAGILLGAEGPLLSFNDTSTVDRAAMVEFIIQSSRGLVEAVDGTSENSEHELGSNPFQLIHETVRQHILAGKLGRLNPDLSCNVEANSHAILGQWCVDYMQMRLPIDRGYPVDTASGVVAWEQLVSDRGDDSAYFQITRAFPFLTYTSFNTFFHLERAFAWEAYDLRRLRDFPLHNWISISNIISFHDNSYRPKTGLLHILLESSQRDDSEFSRALTNMYCMRFGMAHILLQLLQAL